MRTKFIIYTGPAGGGGYVFWGQQGYNMFSDTQWVVPRRAWHLIGAAQKVYLSGGKYYFCQDDLSTHMLYSTLINCRVHYETQPSKF